MIPFGNHHANFVADQLFGITELLQDLLRRIEYFQLGNIYLEGTVVCKVKCPWNNNIAIPLGVEPGIVHIPEALLRENRWYGRKYFHLGKLRFIFTASLQ